MKPGTRVKINEKYGSGNTACKFMWGLTGTVVRAGGAGGLICVMPDNSGPISETCLYSDGTLPCFTKELDILEDKQCKDMTSSKTSETILQSLLFDLIVTT